MLRVLRNKVDTLSKDLRDQSVGHSRDVKELKSIIENAHQDTAASKKEEIRLRKEHSKLASEKDAAYTIIKNLQDLLEIERTKRFQKEAKCKIMQEEILKIRNANESVLKCSEEPSPIDEKSSSTTGDSHDCMLRDVIDEFQDGDEKFQKQVVELNEECKRLRKEKILAVKENEILQSKLQNCISTSEAMKSNIECCEDEKSEFAKKIICLEQENTNLQIEKKYLEEGFERCECVCHTITSDTDRSKKEENNEDNDKNMQHDNDMDKDKNDREVQEEAAGRGQTGRGVGFLDDVQRENEMLRALLEEDEESSSLLEDLEERLFKLEQKKNAEIAKLEVERSELSLDIAASRERSELLEGENKRLREEVRSTTLGIEKLRLRKDRKKSIDDLLKSYQESSEKQMTRIGEEETLSTVSDTSSLSWTTESYKSKLPPRISTKRKMRADAILPSSISLETKSNEKNDEPGMETNGEKPSENSSQDSQDELELMNSIESEDSCELVNLQLIVKTQKKSIDALLVDTTILKSKLMKADEALAILEQKHLGDRNTIEVLESQIVNSASSRDTLQREFEGEKAKRSQQQHHITKLEQQLKDFTNLQESARKMKAELSTSNKSLTIIEKMRLGDRKTIEDMKLQIKKVISSRDSLRQELGGEEAKKDLLQQSFFRVEQELESTRETNRKIRDEINKASSSVNDLQQKRTNVEHSMKEMELQINKSAFDRGALQRELKGEQERNNLLRRQVHKFEQKLKGQVGTQSTVQDLESTVQTLRDECVRLEANLTEANASLVSLTQSHTNVELSMKEMELKAEQSTSDYCNLQQQLESEQTQKKQLQDDVLKLEQKLQDSTNVQRKCQSLNDAMKKEHPDHITDLTKANASLITLQKRHVEDETHLKEMEDLVDEANSDYEALHQELQREQEEKYEVQQQISKLEETLGTFEKSGDPARRALQTTIVALKKGSVKLKTDLANAKSSLSALEQKTVDGQRATKDMKIQISKSGTDYGELQKQLETVINQKDQMQEKIVKLEHEIEIRENSIASSKRISSRQKRLLTEEFESSLKFAEDQIVSLRQKVENQIEKTERNRKAFQKEKRLLQGKKDDLERKAKLAEGEMASLRQKLDQQLRESDRCKKAADKERVSLLAQKEDILKECRELQRSISSMKTHKEFNIQALDKSNKFEKENEELRALLQNNETLLVDYRRRLEIAESALENKKNPESAILLEDEINLNEKLKRLENENNTLLALIKDGNKSAKSLCNLETKLLTLEETKNEEIAMLIKEKRDKLELLETVQSENDILRAMLEEDENKSTHSLEDLEERLILLEQTKDAEITLLTQDREKLQAEMIELRDTILRVEEDNTRLKAKHDFSTSGIEHLKLRRDQKKKSIEDRLRAYESSSCATTMLPSGQVS